MSINRLSVPSKLIGRVKYALNYTINFIRWSSTPNLPLPQQYSQEDRWPELRERGNIFLMCYQILGTNIQRNEWHPGHKIKAFLLRTEISSTRRHLHYSLPWISHGPQSTKKVRVSLQMNCYNNTVQFKPKSSCNQNAMVLSAKID